MEYRFGPFRLAPALREAWREDAPIALPRRVYDCLTYLIEQRARAVGRDELVGAVWGRVDVDDVQVSQLIARVRRAIGDDAQTQTAIRTLPGFGYRWIAATTVEQPATAPVEAPAPVPSAPESSALPTPAASTAAPPAQSRALRTAIALALVAALALAFAAFFFLRGPAVSERRDAARVQAVVVLPLRVDATSELGWVRLGAMALVADRLRGASLPVPAAESVLAALQGVGDEDTGLADKRIEQAFGASLRVHGAAKKTAQGWNVQLDAVDNSGVAHRSEAQDAEMSTAARRAADLIAAALGRVPPSGAVEDDAPQERWQQARSALLAGELATARSLLQSGADADAPEPRMLLAEVEFRGGHPDVAEGMLSKLLDEAAVRADPRRLARAASGRADVRFRRTDFAGAGADYDAAIAALRDRQDVPELARALNGRGLVRLRQQHYDQAAADFGHAITVYRSFGDSLGVAEANANLGRLESVRGHFEQALPYLSGAIERFEAFGAIERVVTVSTAQLDAYAQLLRWPEALAASDRQWALRERIGDAALALLVGGRRGRVLLALGRIDEAQRLGKELRERHANVRAEAQRYLYDFEADLAWQSQRAAEAAAAAEQALATWPVDPSFDRYAHLVLLRQRALIAAGRAEPGTIEPRLAAADAGTAAPAFNIAVAEWAARGGREGEAAAAFQRAFTSAQNNSIPAELCTVAESWTPWLIAHERLDQAAGVAGRVVAWAERDYDCALVQLRLFHAYGRRDSWAEALRNAQALAGERIVPAALATPPAASAVPISPP